VVFREKTPSNSTFRKSGILGEDIYWDIDISAGTRDSVLLPFRCESGRGDEAENDRSKNVVRNQTEPPVPLISQR
jgi:hypothetical protein